MSGHAVAVLLITPSGIPLIRDPKKPSPVFWKLPGGRSEGAETATQCALREVEEEIGISLSADDLTVIHAEDKGSHILTIFQARLAALPQMKSRGNEGEEINLFAPRNIIAMRDFFPNHRKVVGGVLSALV